MIVCINILKSHHDVELLGQFLIKGQFDSLRIVRNKTMVFHDQVSSGVTIQCEL